MSRFLNVGIIQMPVKEDTSVNLAYLEDRLEHMMSVYHKPELVVGIECLQSYTPETIPGPTSDYFASLAKKYGIYFIPGTVYEISDELPEGLFYNSAPIYNPKGELIDVYRKMAPWRPSEEYAAPGRRYVAFDIPEKQTRVGVQICYDLNFPEISRNEALMGAEVLVKLTMDPQELYAYNKHIHYARALENQAYMVSTNGVGNYGGYNLYGNSLVISPEGKLIWEAGQEEAIATVTLDLDLVKRCREYGTGFLDHYIKHVGQYNFPMPFAGCASEAPVFETLSKAPLNPGEYDSEIKQSGAGALGKRSMPAYDMEGFRRNLEKFLEVRK